MTWAMADSRSARFLDFNNDFSLVASIILHSFKGVADLPLPRVILEMWLDVVGFNGNLLCGVISGDASLGGVTCRMNTKKKYINSRNRQIVVQVSITIILGNCRGVSFPP